MNILKEYKEYAKDNPNNLWFKRKVFGWGWTPVTWQGWLTIAVFIALILVISLKLPEKPTTSEITWFFAKIATAVALLITICYKKGEKPEWRWGFPKKKD